MPLAAHSTSAARPAVPCTAQFRYPYSYAPQELDAQRLNQCKIITSRSNATHSLLSNVLIRISALSSPLGDLRTIIGQRGRAVWFSFLDRIITATRFARPPVGPQRLPSVA